LGIGFDRVGVNLSFMDRAAFGAAQGPMFKAGTRRDDALNR
jgi:hypothetical protein